MNATVHLVLRIAFLLILLGAGIAYSVLSINAAAENGENF